jgi:hypothetical protein
MQQIRRRFDVRRLQRVQAVWKHFFLLSKNCPQPGVIHVGATI